MSRLEVTQRVERARAELAAAWPSCTVETRDVLDDRGVAAILVYARAEGRLIVAARAVELVPVDWQLTGGATVDVCVGLLPASLTPTVGEVSAGLGVAW
jgi:hypothetical protein